MDVRAASGTRDDDPTPDDTRPAGIARFTLPRGVIEMRFPGRLSTLRTARRAAQPQYPRQPGEPFAYLHAEHAVAAVTCALEEGMHQRGAYRVATSTEPDGTAFVELGATAGSFCEPNSRWHALIGVRRVGDSTVVMAFQIPSDRSQPLCKTTLRAVQLR